MGLLDGTVAIVTGAGRGIGREEALLLAAEGAKVIVNDMGGALTDTAADEHPADDVLALIKANGGDVAVNGDDIGSWAGGKRVLDQAIDTFSRLDVLVNNAGIVRDKMSFNMGESDWDEVIRVHLKGHFATAHRAAVYWRNRARAGEAVSARIINTSSEAGLYGSAGQANYGAAKAGIASMTLARELERYGITVNAIAPRARTRMTEGVFSSSAVPEDGSFDRWNPKNVTNLVVFLAAPRISGHHRADLRRLRRQHLCHKHAPTDRPAHPRCAVVTAAARGQGRALQGHRLGCAALQLLLDRLRRLRPINSVARSTGSSGDAPTRRRALRRRTS
jgi:NAD(P)-dependent dehydrogenase (short-subunit alcohol dehydrogenase family)